MPTENRNEMKKNKLQNCFFCEQDNRYWIDTFLLNNSTRKWCCDRPESQGSQTEVISWGSTGATTLYFLLLREDRKECRISWGYFSCSGSWQKSPTKVQCCVWVDRDVQVAVLEPKPRLPSYLLFFLHPTFSFLYHS